MLEARKASLWKSRYDITENGRHIATWEPTLWKTGGGFELNGRRYEVRGNLSGTRYGMVADDGSPVASADRVWRRRWTVEADGRTYEFRRASWRQDQELILGDQRVGLVRRTSLWRSDASADLPGLSLPAQVFVLVVVLTVWEQTAVVAAASS